MPGGSATMRVLPGHYKKKDFTINAEQQSLKPNKVLTKIF